jgi:tetratricopeptide (TPR) repeat protein
LIRPFLLALVTVLAAACSSAGKPASSATSSNPLQKVLLPDLSGADESVRTQLQQRYEALQGTISGGAAGEALGTAYGEFGMLLQAAEYFDAAEPAYRNAESLAPRDVRWPYYLGHLYKAQGKPDRAADAFRRAVALAPDDVAALTNLARLYLDRGDAAAAEPLLTRALAQAPRSVPVLAGLGQVALAERQYDRAIGYFEQGLSIDPNALSLHSPLANAYRAVGKRDQAEAHAKQWRNVELVIPDPRQEQLGLTLQSGLAYELRGVRALGMQNWQEAARIFRDGLASGAMNEGMRRSLHHKLGTALYMGGDARGAIAEFQEALRLAPADPPDEATAKANYSLGVLMASGGRLPAAIDYFAGAIKYQPNYADAHLARADALRASRRFVDSLTEYDETLRINPASADARFGHAMALVRLQRYAEARAWLEEAVRLQPDTPIFAHALARVLAAAPDDRVRDGRKALEISNQLVAQAKTIEIGETLAMSMAEVGDFAQAAGIQRELVAAAQRSGMTPIVPRLQTNLRSYEQRRPCRRPWADNDPVNSPGPAVTPDIAAAVRTIH